jgi:hypothetical protein
MSDSGMPESAGAQEWKTSENVGDGWRKKEEKLMEINGKITEESRISPEMGSEKGNGGGKKYLHGKITEQKIQNE